MLILIVFGIVFVLTVMILLCGRQYRRVSVNLKQANLKYDFKNLINAKKIVVIGKASETLQNDYAALVQECDVVVRINPSVENGRIDIHPTVARHTTSRTDVVYHNSCGVGDILEHVTIQENVGMGPVLAESYAASGVTFVVRIDNSGHERVYNNFSETVATFLSPHVVRRNTFRFFGKDVHGLTSGIKSIVDLLGYEPAELHIVGMDCMMSPKHYVPGPAVFEEHRKNNEERCRKNPTECKIGAHKPFNDLKMLFKVYKSHPGIVRPSRHLLDVWETHGLKAPSD